MFYKSNSAEYHGQLGNVLGWSLGYLVCSVDGMCVRMCVCVRIPQFAGSLLMVHGITGLSKGQGKKRKGSEGVKC